MLLLCGPTTSLGAQSRKKQYPKTYPELFTILTCHHLVTSMKELFAWAICALIFGVSTSAQTRQTFDIATFQPPLGWSKRTSDASLQFSTEDKAKGTYCLITLLASVPGTGDPKKNFNAAWQTVVKTVVDPTAVPQMFPSANKEDWKAEGGFAPFEKDGEKGVAVLFTLSGYGKMVNILVLTNTTDHEPTITAFLESVSLKKPAEENRPQAPGNQIGSQPSLAGNFWKQGGIRQGMLGHAGLSTATFSKTYQFLSDGTYKFFTVNMQLAAPKYYLENEEGTYKVTGNTITITPRKASFSQHRLNKEDPPIKSGNLPLSTVQYSFEFWLHDDNWALLLSPVDGNENKRDGTFSFYRNGEPQRTYQYVLVNAKGELIRY